MTAGLQIMEMIHGAAKFVPNGAPRVMYRSFAVLKSRVKIVLIQYPAHIQRSRYAGKKRRQGEFDRRSRVARSHVENNAVHSHVGILMMNGAKERA